MGSEIIDISVVIPSYKDKFLHNTIEDILRNFRSNFEIIPVIDGYELKDPIIKDRRVKPIVLEENGGMRNAINTGVRAAKGYCLMRSDEHCMFAPGFDTVMINSIKPNWIMTARRFALDPHAWAVMEEKGYVDYEKLGIKSKNGEELKFAGIGWTSRKHRRSKIKIDETMAMQGSCWVMTRHWWDAVIQELQSEGYGTHYQDSIEMVFKTWKAGGKLMVNKNTWFAHKARKFNRTHHYSSRRARPEWQYALNTWRTYYENEIRKKWGV